MTKEYKNQQDALQRGASDFMADCELKDNPYSVSDVKYYLWVQGFSETKKTSYTKVGFEHGKVSKNKRHTEIKESSYVSMR
jgi:hypothetical protein